MRMCGLQPEMPGQGDFVTLTRESRACHGARRPALLYFVYTARISPDELANIAPTASFEFIAHLPEWTLEFPIKDKHWGGGLPNAKPEPGHTVWGAVFSLSDDDLKVVNKIEGEEQRVAVEVEAMDRMGKRHQVLTHVYEGNGSRHHTPSAEYLRLMLGGSRHWSLPAGWIAGLEEHLNGH